MAQKKEGVRVIFFLSPVDHEASCGSQGRRPTIFGEQQIAHLRREIDKVLGTYDWENLKRYVVLPDRTTPRLMARKLVTLHACSCPTPARQFEVSPHDGIHYDDALVGESSPFYSITGKPQPALIGNYLPRAARSDAGCVIMIADRNGPCWLLHAAAAIWELVHQPPHFPLPDHVPDTGSGYYLFKQAGRISFGDIPALPRPPYPQWFRKERRIGA